MTTHAPAGENSELFRPDNMGRMNDPDGAADIKGLCGDTMEMYLVVKGNAVEDAVFFTDGCNSSRMCGSAAARMAKGRLLKEVLRISPADIIDSWGGLPGGDVHCAILAVSTLHKALADYLLRTQNG
jgi:nitrogen fixation NifU-like protein